ncbi:Cysteine-rich membrane protein 2 [Spironucleus salmonicida]|uniref:Cysteine-rich membrane protein 2 n=1 Tax=Spironucleus salmonicida TaxID=348837 RepID=V6LDN5_9EUKA|nr:Cysteine-rich membrane protein 2 [Spironucleus salmonicida]|eukprot:EST42363.1 Cysteine-rich membrane protein 2 [Spironucleus salmonicida]
MAETPGTCKQGSINCAQGYFCTDRAQEQNIVEMPCAKCKEDCVTCAGLNAVVNHCTSCKQGEYLSYDNYCRECHKDCEQCTGPEQTCDGCKDGFYDTLGVCEVCLGDEDQEDDCVCGTSKHCLDCNPSNMKQCASCQEGYDISSSTPCEGCLPGYVSIAIKDENICVECDNTCRECSGTKTTCTACNDGFILSGNTCTKCLAETTQICPCGNSLNCTTCNLNNTNACATCKEHYDTTASPPCSKCEPKYFEQNITNGKECTLCRNQCETCMDANKCLTCQNGNFLQSQKCELCYGGQNIACTCGIAKNCGTCDTNKKTKCLTCMHGFASIKVGECDTCSEGYFKKDSKDNFTCEPCTTPSCAQCSANKSQCTKCKHNMFLDDKQQCQQCVKGDGISCNCGVVVNCDTCSTEDEQKCGDCLLGYVSDKNGSCTLCALNYVNIGDKCVKCGVDNCQTCSVDAKTCEKCRNNFAPNNNKCEECRENGSECLCGNAVNCATCTPNADKCKSCVGNFDPKAVTPCIDCLGGFFKSDVSGKSTCTACSDKCTNCTSAVACTACQDGFSVEGGKCVTCEDANCKICSADKNICNTCKTSYKIVGGKCERECNPGDAVCATNQICLGTCKTCSINCTSCEGNVNNCKSCTPGFALDGSSCTACSAGCADCTGNKNVCNLCKDGYFGINGACQSCEMNTTAQCECSGAANCATCTIAKSGTCGTCIAGYKMSASNTCTECADGYLMVDRVCTKCEKSCKICYESIEKCSICADSYTMSIKQTCEKDCTPALTNGKACIGGKAVECDDDYEQITACKCEGAVNCQECKDGNMSTCESCMPGYKLINGQCSECAVGATAVGNFCFDPSIGSQNFLSGGAITGIVIAVLVVVGLIAGGAFWYVKRSKHTYSDIGLVGRLQQ